MTSLRAIRRNIARRGGELKLASKKTPFCRNIPNKAFHKDGKLYVLHATKGYRRA